MPFLAVSRQRHFVFRLYVAVGVSMHLRSYNKRLWTRCLTNSSREFHQTYSVGEVRTKINWVDFEVKRSKVKVVTIPNNQKRILKVMRSVVMVTGTFRRGNTSRQFYIGDHLVYRGLIREISEIVVLFSVGHLSAVSKYLRLTVIDHVWCDPVWVRGVFCVPE